MSEEVSWSPDSMLEVTIKQPDDFLKVRETLQELVLQVEKIKHYTNLAIFYISKVNILLYILKNCLPLTAKRLH